MGQWSLCSQVLLPLGVPPAPPAPAMPQTKSFPRQRCTEGVGGGLSDSGGVPGRAQAPQQPSVQSPRPLPSAGDPGGFPAFGPVSARETPGRSQKKTCAAAMRRTKTIEPATRSIIVPQPPPPPPNRINMWSCIRRPGQGSAALGQPSARRRVPSTAPCTAVAVGRTRSAAALWQRERGRCVARRSPQGT